MHRQILACEIYQEKRKFSRSEAWIDILLRTNHEDTEDAKAGQFVTSYGTLAKAWDWNKNTVWNFMKYLMDKNMIAVEITDKITVITIVNWGIYQASNNGKNNGRKAKKAPAEKAKKEKVMPQIQSTPHTIFDFWNKQNITIHKTLSDVIGKEIAKALKRYREEEIIKAIERYSTIYHDDTYYFKHCWTLANFLKQKNALPDFMEDGQKWIAYKTRGKGTGKQQDTPIADKMKDPYEIKRSWEE